MEPVTIENSSILDVVAERPTHDLFDYTISDLSRFLEEQFAMPSFRATQIFEWVYKRRVEDIQSMTNIGVKDRELLATALVFPKAKIQERQISLDGTRKYLFEVDNGDLVEAVMIKQPTRMTLCVSSQVGCGMNCKFCRTATMGFRRNLRTSEIIQQVLGVIDDAKNFGDMFTNVVFMGMGEPLHNFKGVVGALEVLTDLKGLAIPARKITVSTVGLVPAIKKFGEACAATPTGLANLAVSLNATTDEVRSQVMPINQKFSIAELLETLQAFPLKPRRRITIEYVMLHGINDTPDDLARLPKLLRKLPVKVNLIPYNENAGLGFKSPPNDLIAHWHRNLASSGLDVTVRWSKGQDIKAACGQLATTSIGKQKTQNQAA